MPLVPIPPFIKETFMEYKMSYPGNDSIDFSARAASRNFRNATFKVHRVETK